MPTAPSAGSGAVTGASEIGVDVLVAVENTARGPRQGCR